MTWRNVACYMLPLNIFVVRHVIYLLCPHHDNGRGIKCYPCPSIRTLRTYVPIHVHSLSRIFFIRILWNLVTLFCTMMSSSRLIMVHIALGFQELWLFVYEKSPFWNDVRSLTQIFFIRILWNLVTLFSTIMSSSSLIMVHIAPCFL